MTRKAIVTGGAGFIGSHLVELLVDGGWELLVIDDLSTGSLENIGPARRRGKVAVHVMDIRAPELPEVAGRFGPEVIFHLAAQSKVPVSMEDPVFDADVNVVGTLNVLQAAHRCSARRVVATSSVGIYGGRVRLPVKETSTKRPESPYGISKKVVEDYFRWYHELHGLAYVLLAPANVYGPRQDPGLEGGVVAIFSRAMVEERRPTIFGDGSQTRDFVYVADVVDAFLRAADAGEGRLVNLGSGRETTVLELYDLLAGITGYSLRPQFEAPKPGDIYRSVIDPARAKAALDWEAWTPLEEGLARTVDWYRSRPAP
jgi:UDP-glucose 4-epimerase